MTREQVHDLMENELRCVQRGNYCDRDCAKCPLVKDDKELIEAYVYVIKALEQEPIVDKIRAEIVDTLYVDSLIFGELIDFKNGKISADDVIEEFNRVTRIEVLKILDKYKAESEK